MMTSSAQYALALALTRLNAAWRVLWFPRGTLAVRPTAQPARPVLSQAYNLPAVSVALCLWGDRFRLTT